MLNHTKACCRESSSLIPGWVNKSEQLPQARARAFPLGAVQRMWKKPVKSPDVTTVFVSPFKEDSTLRCSYTVLYLHSVFCAFQEIYLFFFIKRGNLIWSSFMSGIVSLHEPRRLCNNPERTSMILHLHKAVGVLVISESEMQFEKKVRQSTCSVVRVHLSTHLCKTLNGTQW